MKTFDVTVVVEYKVTVKANNCWDAENLAHDCVSDFDPFEAVVESVQVTDTLEVEE